MREPEQLSFEFMKEVHDGQLTFFSTKQKHVIRVAIPEKNRVIYL